MISENDFIKEVKYTLKRDIEDNAEQKDAILDDVTSDEYVVAGPGSGKTTTLVLKILKYYFVDGIDPSCIMITTFTKKAARQLKDKTIGWAEKLANSLGVVLTESFDEMIIGTLDSIAEEYVRNIDSVSVIDNFTSSALMMQTLLKDERNMDKKLKQFIKKISDNQSGISTASMNNTILSLRSAMYNDMVDMEKLKSEADWELLMYEIIDEYNMSLDEKSTLDYPLLETRFYELLNENKISYFKDNLRVLLVDEYQDTNYLQEQIYFKLATYTKKNNGNITVVGDDDQALYRFRGANVSLFTNYIKRIENQINITPKTIYLHANYRSTPEIIDFLNEYITLDKKYITYRSTSKPKLTLPNLKDKSYPIVGLFRNNIEELTYDLANLIYDLKTGKKVDFKGEQGDDFNVQFDDPSIALLINSPKEINAYNKKRLPYFIRNTLSGIDDSIVVFNPRGQNIEATEIVSLICGLILVSIDPTKQFEDTITNLPPRTYDILKHWRKYATEYLNKKGEEVEVVNPEHVHIDELLKDIKEECKTIKDMSAENEIYHNLIIETIKQTSDAITYDGTLSSYQLFWHILIPIALGAIDMDDDLFDVNLYENINIMSIHQAKGLEFDVVIVDVGSDIYNAKKSSAFKRFPYKGGKTYNIEKYIRCFSDLEILSENEAVDVAFNELIRRYFVAYSRSKTLLILCGLTSMRYGNKGNFQDKILIPNVATGWNRNKVWLWEYLDNLYNI